MTTFDDLGIPFPLYKAPVETCASYVGERICVVSGEARRHCFQADGWFLRTCPSCGLETVHDLFYGRSNCYECKEPLPEPAETCVSYEELRAGRAGFGRDTVYGLVTRRELETGWCDGYSGRSYPGVETRTSESGRLQIRVPTQELVQLSSTPDYLAIQGACWRFSETRPLVYVGVWKQEDFAKNAPQGMTGRDFFLDILEDADPRLWESFGWIEVHVFKDDEKNTLTAYYDMD